MGGRNASIIQMSIEHVNAKLKTVKMLTVLTTILLTSKEHHLANSSRSFHAIAPQISQRPSIPQCSSTSDSLNRIWVVSKSHPFLQWHKRHGLAWLWHVVKIERQDIIVFNPTIPALEVASPKTWAWKRNPSYPVEWGVNQYQILTLTLHQEGWEK